MNTARHRILYSKFDVLDESFAGDYNVIKRLNAEFPDVLHVLVDKDFDWGWIHVGHDNLVPLMPRRTLIAISDSGSFCETPAVMFERVDFCKTLSINKEQFSLHPEQSVVKVTGGARWLKKVIETLRKQTSIFCNEIVTTWKNLSVKIRKLQSR